LALVRRDPMRSEVIAARTLALLPCPCFTGGQSQATRRAPLNGSRLVPSDPRPKQPARVEDLKSDRDAAVKDLGGREVLGSSQALCKVSEWRRPATEQSEGAQLGAPTERARVPA